MKTNYVFTFCAVTLAMSSIAAGQGSKSDYERALSLEQRTRNKVFRSTVRPHWLPGGTSFWYRVETGPKKKEYVFVDAVKGTRKPDFPAPPEKLLPPQDPDVSRRSQGKGDESSLVFVNRTAGTVELFWLDFHGKRCSYGTIKAGAKTTQHTFAGHVWLVQDSKGREIALVEAAHEPARVELDGSPLQPPQSKNGVNPGTSPDGRWTAFRKNYNVWLREITTGMEYALSSDGKADHYYEGSFNWSPDSTRLVAMQVIPAQEHKVYFVESSPKDQIQPKLHTIDYLKPGDRIAHPRPKLFDVTQRSLIDVQDDLFPTPWSIGDIHWMPDSSRFTFLYNQRGHQVLRVLAVDARTGVVRPIVDEVSPTFIDYSQKTFLHWLDASGELIWMSERDGWNHLWLYDTRAGAVKNQITRGNWVVRQVEFWDEEQRQVWFLAGGVRPGQDPYYQHLCRVNFDGSGFVVLTEGDGTHSIEFSPDRRWFVDTWSRVDQAPVTELRSSSNGRLICLLEKADASALLATGWTMPEIFTAKGRDNKTDIYGIIVRPSNFDPARKYPVIENIYAGPHGSFVPKEWNLLLNMHALAELGFVVVQVDGMGTNWRSRQFHDVCWKNLKDAGFPDRIAWMCSAAAKRPWMDMDRVGIYGGSTGGMNTLGGLLHHGDFYKVGVADCGCHDNRMDKIWWNEAWMSWPVGPEYADNSNVTHANKLQGKLLLIVGEIDNNVDPASTMQVVNALEKADKDFDLLVMTGTGHGAAETGYANRRRMDFFVRNLLGKEPRWTD